jgi:hypothetical protein
MQASFLDASATPAECDRRASPERNRVVIGMGRAGKRRLVALPRTGVSVRATPLLDLAQREETDDRRD